jgi:hypothetical protein
MSVAVVEPAGLTINDPRRRIFATIEASVGNPVKWYDCRSYSRGAVSSRSKAFDVVGTALPMTSLYTSCGAPVKAEPFPTQARAPRCGLSYTVANAIFGGTAEYAALQLKSRGFEAYSLGMSLLSAPRL